MWPPESVERSLNNEDPDFPGSGTFANKLNKTKVKYVENPFKGSGLLSGSVKEQKAVTKADVCVEISGVESDAIAKERELGGLEMAAVRGGQNLSKNYATRKSPT